MSVLSAIVGVLGGPVVAIGQELAAAYRAKTEAASDGERTAAEERVKRLEARRDVLVAEQGHWLTRLPRLLFALPLAVWWAAVIADSLFRFRWNVAALPAPLDEWAGWIVSALFLAEAVERTATRVARR